MGGRGGEKPRGGRAQLGGGCPSLSSLGEAGTRVCPRGKERGWASPFPPSPGCCRWGSNVVHPLGELMLFVHHLGLQVLLVGKDVAGPLADRPLLTDPDLLGHLGGEKGEGLREGEGEEESAGWVRTAC